MGAAVTVEEVSKRFRLYHDRPQTLKERVVRFKRPRFEEFWAVRDVSFDVAAGETFGLIGPNGSGKSTLLKILGGILRPDRGRVSTIGRTASLLELGAGFHPELTGRENVYMNASILGLTRRETDRHYDAITAFAELEPFMDMQVKHYSSGMYVRLGFAVAVHVDPEILLIDEVLAVGDEAFQRKCMDRIRTFQKEGRTIVFVTHAVDTVRDICSRAAFLHHGKMAALGQPSDVVRRYRETVHGEAQLEAAPLQERGTREVRVVEVAIQDWEGRRRQLFKAGENLEVVVDLDAAQPVDDPVVGVAVYDHRDVLVFGTNTGLRGILLGTLQGRRRVRFRFGDLPLAEGRYNMTVGVHSRDERTVYHWQEKTYSFQCVKTGTDAGFVSVPTEIVVEDS